MTPLAFFVPGHPAPGGSKRAFAHKSTGRIIVTDDSKRNKPWRQSVEAAAHAAMGRMPLYSGALVIRVEFHMPRPKAHYHTGKRAGELRANAPTYHTSKPDATKLLRAVEDAMTGIVWRDDAQVVCQEVWKMYADGATGADVKVATI